MLLILKKAVRLPVEIWLASSAIASVDFSRKWLKLGLLSLLLSGMFSAIIVLARTPGLAELISDPLFARKSLVLHVDLALIIWFYAFLSVLYLSLNGMTNTIRSAAGLKLAIAGPFLMICSIFFQGAEPILANYIPVLDHPVFITGLVLFGAGLLLTFSNSFSVQHNRDDKEVPSFYTLSASQTIRCTGIILLAAILTILASWIITLQTMNSTTFYELVMWGGGHILQFANVLGMVTVWLILLYKLTGSDVISSRINRLLLFILVVPALLSPILLLKGTSDQLYYTGFTHLMRWFIFPVVTCYMIIGIRAIWMAKRDEKIRGNLLKNVWFNGFFVSVLLTVTGFLIGAMIRGSSTLIPAHYHASLGGVTVAYMTMVFILMKEFGYSLDGLKSSRFVPWQPLLFGIGQTLFVIGFAYAGMQGMGRKMFGQDQSIQSIEALTGLGLMSIGGLLAMAGGLLFLFIIIESYIKQSKHQNHGRRRKNTPGTEVHG
jgi:cytochrome c oxidase subunit I